MNIVQQLTQELRNCTKDFTELEAELRETKATLESVERDVKELHTALDEVTALFVSQHGFEYRAIEAALAALARNRARFPITVALAEKLDAGLDQEPKDELDDDPLHGKFTV